VTKLTDPQSVQLTFTVNPGQTYVVQSSLDLKTWSNNGNPIVPTAGSTTATTTVSLAAPPFSTATQVYFRVTSLP
jgi:hypothetical protein